jgi:hypothetical protein
MHVAGIQALPTELHIEILSMLPPEDLIWEKKKR